MRLRVLPVALTLFSSCLFPAFAVARPSTSVTLTVPSPATGSVDIYGSAKAGSISRVDLTVDGLVLKSCYARQCAASWNTAGTANGSHRVQARALLSDGRVVSKAQTVTVANADVVPTAVALGSNTLLVGATTPVQLTVTNRGTAAAHSVTATIILMASGGAKTPIATLSLGTLAAGASGTVGTTLVAPGAAGTYTVSATAVTTDPEASATNNTTTTPLTVASRIADLVASGLTLGSATLTAGGSTPLQLVVSNRGTAAAQSVAVGISVSAGGATTRVATITVGTLAAGASGTYGTRLTAPTVAGTYSVNATAATPDPEVSTSNNGATATLEVSAATISTAPPAMADLMSSALTLGSATLSAGGTTSVKVTVSNLGKATAQSVTMAIGLGTGGTTTRVASITVGSLAAGASGTVATTLTAPTVSGTYTVSATASTPDSETSTANNTTSASLSVASAPSTTTPAPICHYYAAPSGTGNGLSLSSPFQIASFWAVAAPGKVLCLLDGTYQGAASMINPAAASGVNGTQGNPVTVRALHDGGVTIDGQFTQLPINLNNSWWVIEGVNARNSLAAVVTVRGSHNTIRRVVAWDAHFAKNVHVMLATAADNILFEDVAAFGGGRRPFSVQGASNVTFRRAWGSWGGSITIGPKTTITMGYNSYNVVCENCLMTWSAESMPQEYDATGPDGLKTTAYPGLDGRYTNFVVEAAYRPFGEDNVANGPNGACMAQTILGSLAYVKAGVRFGAPYTGPGSDQRSLIQQGGSDHACNTIRHTLAIMAPAHANFKSIVGFIGGSGGGTATNTTSIYGGQPATADSWNTAWTRSLQAEGSSTLSTPSPWTTTGAGANLCYRWDTAAGAPGTVPLWPWPMNDRIKQATGSAGYYGQGYADAVVGCGAGQGSCVGGRATRVAMNVMADVESLLGPIPAQCRND